MPTVIANGMLATLKPKRVWPGYILVNDDGVIETVAEDAIEGDHAVHDVHGALVMPGNVCAHTHLYSALARGMPPPPLLPRNFPEILRFVWWRLDRALDEPSIETSALVGAIDALKAGTTTLIDHHASPNCIDGSLDMIAEQLSHVGIRSVLCYEVTDRNGRDGRTAGLKENERFVRTGTAGYRNTAALIGAHASFTLDDDSLEAVGALAQDYGVGVHIHAAEDICDQQDSLRRSGQRVAHRLDQHGIVRADSVLAHGVHLDGEELRLLGKHRAWLVHNCRSNLNNGVGRAGIDKWQATLPGRSALGTDGIDGDMFSETRSAYFRSREASLERTADELVAMLAAGADLVAQSFGRPAGRIEPGAVADLMVLEYDPPTPMTQDNIAWHWMFGMTDALVRDVMVAGKWVVLDRTLVGADEERVRAEARSTASDLWRRMQDIPA